MSSHSIFAYGTLMDQPFVERMLGHAVEMKTALLDNYVRLEPSYYMIFPHDKHWVNGVVITGLTPDDVAKFDRYEGNDFGYYDRQPVTILTSTGEVKAEAYVGGPHMQWFYREWLEDQAQDN